MATYPDALAGVRAVLDTLRGSTYYYLTVDYAKQPLPAYLIYTTGGDERFPFREDRVTVETYDETTTGARRAAETARGLLAEGPHDAKGILLDQVSVDTVPHDIPQHEGYPALVAATYRVSTRAI